MMIDGNMSHGLGGSAPRNIFWLAIVCSTFDIDVNVF